MKNLLALLCWLSLAIPAWAQVSAVDDAGALINLPAPAKRIVSLSPHITELLFAAGAGAKVVGVMGGSDYPLEARRLPQVGGASAINLEAVIALKPDLVLAWPSGNPPAHLARLRALKVPVFLSEPKRLSDLPGSVQRLGVLAGTPAKAQAAARALEQRLAALAQHRADGPPLRVFYPIWHAPLMTLNKDHIISDALRLCGGDNIFGRLPQLTPTVSVEAVLAANPEVIISTEDQRERWRAWPKLAATAHDNFCTVNADWMSRAGPRMADGAEQLCACLEGARLKRASAPPTRPR